MVNWDIHLTLVEISYNNSYYSSIYMAPFEALYRRRSRSLIGWFEVDDSSLLCPNLINKTSEKVHIIRNRLKIAYSQQKAYADHKRRNVEFYETYKVYLNISPMKGAVRFLKNGI